MDKRFSTRMPDFSVQRNFFTAQQNVVIIIDKELLWFSFILFLNESFYYDFVILHYGDNDLQIAQTWASVTDLVERVLNI